MQQYTIKEFKEILYKNKYVFNRQKGGHLIYIKDGIHISVPRKLKSVIALKLIKQYNLIT